MNPVEWDKEKNVWVKAIRGISFEDVVTAIEQGKVLDDYVHPNQKRYPGQRMMVVDIQNYAYLVPYVQDAEKIFLKTVIPSRKATKTYLK